MLRFKIYLNNNNKTIICILNYAFRTTKMLFKVFFPRPQVIRGWSSPRFEVMLNSKIKYAMQIALFTLINILITYLDVVYTLIMN